MSRWLESLGLWGRFVVSFYRLVGWRTKVSGLRPLGYVVLGYVMATLQHPALLLVNLAAIAGLLMFFGAYGNYWDWQLQDELNSTRYASEGVHASRNTAFVLSLLPLGVSAGWLAVAWGMGASVESIALFGLITLVGAAYITPGIRLKVRRGGFLLPPCVACLLFLQAYALTGQPLNHLRVWLFCGALWCFQFQAELLHLLDDCLHDHTEPVRFSSESLARWLRRVPGLALCGSVAAAWVSPWFLNSALWWAVRLKTLRAMELEQVTSRRQQLWHPLWSLQEFLIYALWGGGMIGLGGLRG